MHKILIFGECFLDHKGLIIDVRDLNAQKVLASDNID